MSFGDRLRATRLDRGITQQRLSDLVGVALRTYQQYEQGKTEPSYSVLVALADVIDVPIDYLLGRDDYLEAKRISFTVPKTPPQRRRK